MMRKFLSFLFIAFLSIGLILHEAEAKRFGGGRSFGMQRSSSSFNRSSFSSGSSFTQNKSAFNQPQSTASKWLGPLAGLAAGGLLASLFMGHGIGSGILSWLLVGGLFLLLINFLRNRMQPAAPPRQAYGAYTNQNQFVQDAASQFMRNSHQAHADPVNSYPMGFNAEQFLRDAKVQFIRLQAAYDQKNLNDLREFTTPEVYAEIQMQFHERGQEDNKTNVINLDADLLDVATDSQLMAQTEMQGLLASVRFSGLIQENREEAAAPFNEIWHFKKEIANQRWLVAGIQQS